MDLHHKMVLNDAKNKNRNTRKLARVIGSLSILDNICDETKMIPLAVFC